MILLYINFLIILAQQQGNVYTLFDENFKWIVGGLVFLAWELFKINRKNVEVKISENFLAIGKIIEKLEKKMDLFFEHQATTDKRLDDVEAVQRFCNHCPKD